MEQSDATTTAGLESQLRNMILGNVTIGRGQTNQDVHSAHRGRGRGRGRGGFTRGSDRTHPHQQEQSQSWRTPGQHDNYQPRGRGRAHPPGQRHNQQQNRDSQTENNAGRSNEGLYQNRNQHFVPRSPRQPHGQPTGAGGPPQILQRPQNDHIQPGQGLAGGTPSRPHNFHQPRSTPNYPRENPMAQAEHLEALAMQEIPKVEMSIAELDEKEAFRRQLESHLREAFTSDYSGEIANISLVGFGSLASGFAMPGSDMDLAVVPEWKDASSVQDFNIDRKIPRLLERAILDAKMGGRLLTRTRVPILKVCQSPPEELYTALVEERQKWDDLPEEEQYPSDVIQEIPTQPKALAETEAGGPVGLVHQANSPNLSEDFPELGAPKSVKKSAEMKSKPKSEAQDLQSTPPTSLNDQKAQASIGNKDNKDSKDQHARSERPWQREKVLGPLDFPKTGCGIQCDINFGNPLGIHNTHMLRCYSLTDRRVQPIVLFVKSWAKRRKVNSSYSGTLSSYGWVLMVLHYLVNVVKPPVCPNLQHSIPPPTDVTALEQFFKETTVGGYNVRFWRNEGEILQAAHEGRLSQNRESVGELLRGFFQYYAGISPGFNYGPRPPQFYWTNEVLSLRTLGGTVSKQSKGWVSATTKVTAEKKVTNRYLFAIEDPFEIDHNVARTVTHRGIVAIRDEFRRAWRILRAIGQGQEPEGGLFDEVIEAPPPATKEEGKETFPKGTMDTLAVDDVALKANGQHSVV